MARKRKFVFLSEEDKKRFCSANCDLETGNFCIRPRTEYELKAIAELSQAYKAVGEDTATPMQKEIVEWAKICSDPQYAKENGYYDDKLTEPVEEAERESIANDLILTRENKTNISPLKIGMTFGVRLKRFTKYVGKNYGAGDMLIDLEWAYLEYMAEKIISFQKDTANEEDKLYFNNLEKNLFFKSEG